MTTAYEAAEKLVDVVRRDPTAATTMAILARMLEQRVLVPNDLIQIASTLDAPNATTFPEKVRNALFKAIASHGRRSDGKPPGPRAA